MVEAPERVLKIYFCLGGSGRTILEIYNTAGERIRVLFDEMTSEGSQYHLEWDLKNMKGDDVASGIYIVHFTPPAGEFVRDAKVLVLRP